MITNKTILNKIYRFTFFMINTLYFNISNKKMKKIEFLFIKIHKNLNVVHFLLLSKMYFFLEKNYRFHLLIFN